MTEDERRERIEATASRMIAELLERAANGEALPVQGAFVVRIRALAEEIGDADSITIEARDMALFKDLAAQMVLASAAAAIDGAAAAGADDAPLAFRPTRGPTKH
jgi:predicted Zn-dependent protease